MLAAESLFVEGRHAAVDRATAVVNADTGDVRVERFARRRLLRSRRADASANVPDTRLAAIRLAAAFVASNHALLDAAEAGTPDTLDPAAAAIEEEVAALDPHAALARFVDESATLLERLRARPDLDVDAVYPVARTASDLAAFVAVELHLIARMLDPTYEPADARSLMHVLNESLRSMLGHGAEDWVSERVKPWRNMVIRRGLAWP
ncbi:MAG: hypothetical protein AAF081_07890 [Actinomycetota bacterium]